MATPSATRQAAYRRRHLACDHMVRLDLWVDAETKRALQRRARRQGVTLREALRQLVAAEGSMATSQAPPAADDDDRESAGAAMRHEPAPPMPETPVQKFERTRMAALRALARRAPPAHECAERQGILGARRALDAAGIAW